MTRPEDWNGLTVTDHKNDIQKSTDYDCKQTNTNHLLHQSRNTFHSFSVNVKHKMYFHAV